MKTNRLSKMAIGILTALILNIVPSTAFSLPLQEQDFEFSAFDFFTFTTQVIAVGNVRVFAPGVNDLAEDARFASVTPLTSDYTYFIQIENTAPGSTFLNSIRVAKAENSLITGAGYITIGGSAIPVPSGFLTPTSVIFDFSTDLGDPVFPGETRNLFITSPAGPDVGSANLIFNTFPFGATSSFIGPYQNSTPVPTPVPNPEPGTILLLGSGLLGLAAFSRKKLGRRGI